MPSDHADLRRWLGDIQYHIVLAHGFVAGANYETFRDGLRTVHAVIRCLEIISKASRRLPDSLKSRHVAIQWCDMAAAGNIYRHEYEDVAAHEVWDTLCLHLPQLHAVVEQELAALGDA